MQKSQRVIVQKETITAFTTLKYVYPRANKVIELNDNNIKSEISKAKFYEDAASLTREIVPEKQEKPEIQIVDGDCLIRALDLKEKGFNPLVLNMACATNVGGGRYRFC